MSVDPVRRLALATLLRVGEGVPLDTALDAALAATPDPRGRALLAELVKGAVRWRGRYDHLIRRFSRRGAVRRPAALQETLRLGLHQVLACEGIPAHAAVHQTVELCRADVSTRSAAYVNALLQGVLRAAGPAGPQRVAALRGLFPDPEREPAAHLAAWHSHPLWLVERWLGRWERAAVEALCEHDNRAAPVTLHVLAPADPGVVAARLAAAGWAAVPGAHHPRALILQGRPDRAAVRALLAAEPHVVVQDEGAQAATAWLAEGAGGRLLDLCAAPGGKLFHLRARWPDPGSVVAMDRAPSRLAPLLETAKRIAGGAPSVLLADGEAPPFRPGSFDTVLLDGPCSGTGVLRHHPEGRWRLRPQRLAEGGERLLRLARAAAGLLAPGGRLLYVTCSLEAEENENVVARLLSAAEGRLEPDPHPAGEGGPEARRAWLPQATGTDGFFAVRLRRR